MTELHCFLADETQQLALAAQLAKVTEAGDVVYLIGDLGAGKTTLVRGFLQAMGYEGNVKSPTYTLVEPYHLSTQTIYHFDLYRLGTPDELEYAGGRDYFDGQSISLIEWPEKAWGYLPEADLIFNLSYHTENGVQGRNCQIAAGTESGASRIRNLSNYLD